MELVLSPLLDDPKSKGKVYAGRWCLRPGVNPKDHRIVSYPWNNREKLYSDYAYLEDLHETCLYAVRKSLNETLSLNRSLVFWRTLIGPWLINFNSAVLEKIRVLEQAKMELGSFSLKVVNPPLGEVSPRDYIDYGHLSLEDGFQQLLFSRIARTMEDLIQEERVNSFIWKSKKTNSSSIKQRILRYLPKLQGKIFFASTFFPIEDLAFLQTKLNQLPSLDRLPAISTHSVFDCEQRNELRASLRSSATDTELRLILDLIGEFLPVSYFEGLRELESAANKVFPQRSRLILSGNVHYSHDGFKVWLGDRLEAGAKLAVVQHGGLFGAAKWCAFEKHDLKIAHRYFSWGWEKKGEPIVTPAPAPRLMRITARKKSCTRGKALLVTNGFPKYFYRPLSAPVGEQTLDFLELDFNFVRALGDFKKHLKVRLYHADQGWGERIRWDNAKLDVDYKPTGLSLRDELASARLFVGTHNTTTFLEAFTMNIPSIVYWNPDHWELREEAAPFYNLLRAAGILFDSPEAAATKVKQVYDDPMAWWKSPNVTHARKLFCEYFAKVSPNATEQWLTELKDLLRSFQDDAGTLVLPSTRGEAHARI